MALRKSIRWRSLEHGGLEECRISEWDDSIKVRSAIVGQAGEMRYGVLYELSLRPDWTFEAALFQRTDGVMSVLRRGEDGWFDMHADDLPGLEGCIDIDFEMTPLTNTLPIRRAPLAIGETRRFKMPTSPLRRSSRLQSSISIRGSANACTASRRLTDRSPRTSASTRTGS